MQGRAVRGNGFTLVELLAVLAIILLLIAILLPTLRKARRKALILVSPIAYVGIDGNLYVIPPSGGTGVDLVRAYGALGYPGRWHVQWSPCGQKIGFSTFESAATMPGPNPATVCIVNPMNGTVLRHSDQRLNGFRTWLDTDNYLATSYHVVPGEVDRGMIVRDAASGDVRQKLPSVPKVSFDFLSISRLPPTTDRYHYVVSCIEAETWQTTIRLWTKDLRPGKLIWSGPSTTYGPFPSPAVDPSGQWVAWTMYTVSSGGQGVAIKSIKADASVPPVVVGREFEYCYFCDWTEQGNLLVNASEPPRRGSHDAVKWGLKILDRNGKLMREIPTDVPPHPAAIASWRKHWHY